MKNIFRILRLIIASVQFIRDPKKLDDVLEISHTINNKREVRLWADYLKTLPRASEALKTRPLIRNLDLHTLSRLPPETLGNQFADFLLRRGFKPEDIWVDPDAEIKGSEEDYILSYLYSTHDLYHVMTGFDTDLAGELGLQAFYASKSVSVFPLYILALGLLNAVFFERNDKDRRLDAIARGWKLGRESENLFGVDWAGMWNKKLTEVRREFRLAV